MHKQRPYIISTSTEFQYYKVVKIKLYHSYHYHTDAFNA